MASLTVRNRKLTDAQRERQSLLLARLDAAIEEIESHKRVTSKLLTEADSRNGVTKNFVDLQIEKAASLHPKPYSLSASSSLSKNAASINLMPLPGVISPPPPSKGAPGLTFSAKHSAKVSPPNRPPLTVEAPERTMINNSAFESAPSALHSPDCGPSDDFAMADDSPPAAPSNSPQPSLALPALRLPFPASPNSLEIAPASEGPEDALPLSTPIHPIEPSVLEDAAFIEEILRGKEEMASRNAARKKAIQRLELEDKLLREKLRRLEMRSALPATTLNAIHDLLKEREQNAELSARLGVLREHIYLLKNRIGAREVGTVAAAGSSCAMPFPGRAVRVGGEKRPRLEDEGMREFFSKMAFSGLLTQQGL